MFSKLAKELGAEKGISASEQSPVEKQGLRKNIYLLPNFITTIALFFGFYAIISALNHNVETAIISVLIAAVFDVADGRIARLTDSTSVFGAEYDSLSDMVAFGVAPAIIAFTWGLSALGNVGGICVFIYTACTALRLARFNQASSSKVEKTSDFIGLASPAAAIIVVSSVWTFTSIPFFESQALSTQAWFVAPIVFTVSVLMVSSLRYWSPKRLTFRSNRPLVSLFSFIMICALVAIDPAKVVLTLFSLYALSGPLHGLFSWLRQLFTGAAKKTTADYSENKDKSTSAILQTGTIQQKHSNVN